MAVAGCADTPGHDDTEAWPGPCEHLREIEERPLVVMQSPHRPESIDDDAPIELRLSKWDVNEREIKMADSHRCAAFNATMGTKYYGPLARIIVGDCNPTSGGFGSFVVDEDLLFFTEDAWSDWQVVCTDYGPPEG